MVYLYRKDISLVKIHQSGDLKAFGILVKRYEKQVFKLALRRLHSVELAEDATLETFMTMHKHIQSYEIKGEFKAYLFYLLMNQCRNMTRGQNREIKALAKYAYERSNEEKLDMEREYYWSEAKRRLSHAVDTLPDIYREIFFLRYDAKLSVKVIAEQLDVPAGTVKSRLHAGAQLLLAIEEKRSEEMALGSQK